MHLENSRPNSNSYGFVVQEWIDTQQVGAHFDLVHRSGGSVELRIGFNNLIGFFTDRDAFVRSCLGHSSELLYIGARPRKKELLTGTPKKLVDHAPCPANDLCEGFANLLTFDIAKGERSTALFAVAAGDGPAGWGKALYILLLKMRRC